MVFEARYENGVFKPLSNIELREGTVVEIHVNSTETLRRVRPISELGFVGMWADRADIKNGVSYVDNLRDSPRA